MQKLFSHAILLTVFLAFLASCQYKDIVEPAIAPPNPIDTIYFSYDILPIWNDGNNCTMCHHTGGPAPDLTPDRAYGSINNMGLVDMHTPAESFIYLFPHPDTDTHTWKKYTANQAALVLQWIEQGALDN